MSIKEAEIVEPEKPERKSKAIAKRESQALERSAPSMAEVLMSAVEGGAPIETLERIAKMVEEAQARNAAAAFFDALARFQSLVPEIPKRKQGYGYLYAPIGDIDKAIKGAAKECGLSKRWTQIETNDQVTVSCVVTHVGGHSETSSIGPVSWDLLERTDRMNGLQHRAAVISYLQRYTLVAAFGLATADDDIDAESPKDAREARKPVSQPKPRPSTQKAAQPAGSKRQLEPAATEDEAIPPSTQKGLAMAMDKAKLSEDDFLKRFAPLTGLEQLRKTDAQAVMSWIADPQRN